MFALRGRGIWIYTRRRQTQATATDLPRRVARTDEGGGGHDNLVGLSDGGTVLRPLFLCVSVTQSPDAYIGQKRAMNWVMILGNCKVHIRMCGVTKRLFLMPALHGYSVFVVTETSVVSEGKYKV